MTASSTFRNLPPDKQERILDGALSEFASNGFARASLNSLVSRLGISKGSIFQYFKDKNGLFGSVFEYAIERVKTHLRGVRSQTADQDVFQRLHQSLMSGLDLIEANPRLFQLYLRIVFEGGVPFRQTMLQSVRLFSRDYIMDLLRDGVAQGQLRPDLDLEMAAFVLDASLERFLIAFSQEHMDTGLGLHGADRRSAAALADKLIGTLRVGLGAAS